MRKNLFWHMIAGIFLFYNLQAQEAVSPQKVAIFHPIQVQNPVMLDSTDLNNKIYNNEMLLSSPVSFPAQERFTTELTPDSAGFFHFIKPEQGEAIQLLS